MCGTVLTHQESRNVASRLLKSAQASSGQGEMGGESALYMQQMSIFKPVSLPFRAD